MSGSPGNTPACNAPAGRFDPRRCVVLVPYFEAIHPDCEAALRELEGRGYTVRRVGGYSQIDVARNQMASDALRDGFDETLWIDADIVFQPDSVERLRMHPHGVVGGLYARKGSPGFAVVSCRARILWRSASAADWSRWNIWRQVSCSSAGRCTRPSRNPAGCRRATNDSVPR
jgi:hypothetical protein